MATTACAASRARGSKFEKCQQFARESASISELVRGSETRRSVASERAANANAATPTERCDLKF
jgi:hypothetical protein